MILSRCGIAALLLSSPPGVSAAAPTETVRQEREVLVNGVAERWRLKWLGPVKPACAATELESAMSCPCAGFAYGEEGRLTLERLMPNGSSEQLDLGQFFDETDGASEPGHGILRRWNRDSKDPSENSGTSSLRQKFVAQVKQRPEADVMDMQDFTHEGAKTGFLLQVGNAPCGRNMMVLIGVSKKNPHLHAFTSLAHPKRPLLLQRSHWNALLKAKTSASDIALPCGDHGSETEIEKSVTVRDGVFEVSAREYACRDEGGRGKLLHRTAE
ncbi:MAG TPA: hypothetical protein DCW29_08880 [Janthinobacterium sp.]|nr:hypothetical protein [Janthinobacterium sp.]